MVKLFICQLNLKTRRKYFVNIVHTNSELVLFIQFGFSIIILTKFSYKLFALFVSTKGLAKTRSVSCFAHLNDIKYISISGTNSLLLDHRTGHSMRVSRQTYDHTDLSSSCTKDTVTKR